MDNYGPGGVLPPGPGGPAPSWGDRGLGYASYPFFRDFMYVSPTLTVCIDPQCRSGSEKKSYF